MWRRNAQEQGGKETRCAPKRPKGTEESKTQQCDAQENREKFRSKGCGDVVHQVLQDPKFLIEHEKMCSLPPEMVEMLQQFSRCERNGSDEPSFEHCRAIATG